MHEVHSNLTTVSVSESLIQFSECPIFLLTQNTSQLWNINIELSIQVSFGKTIELVVNQLSEIFCRMGILAAKIHLSKDLVQVKGVDVSLEMAVSHKGSN